MYTLRTNAAPPAVAPAWMRCVAPESRTWMRGAFVRCRSSWTPREGDIQRGHPAPRARLASSRPHSLALRAGWDLCAARTTIHRLRARSASLPPGRVRPSGRDRAKSTQVGGKSRAVPQPRPRGRRLRAPRPRVHRGWPPVFSRAADNASVIETKRSGRANQFRSNDQARNCTIFPWRGPVEPPKPWVPRAKGKRGPVGQSTGSAWARSSAPPGPSARGRRPDAPSPPPFCPRRSFHR